jgi:hypothetical protein
MATPTITLDEAVQRFEQWRESRCSRSTPIPDDLRRLAVALHGRYKISQITDALRLSHGQYKQWCQTDGEEAPTVEFIALPNPAVLPSITLHHPNGARLEIAGDLDLVHFACLVRHFVGSEVAI